MRTDARTANGPVIRRVRLVLEAPPPAATIAAIANRVDKRNTADMQRVIGIPIRSIAPPHAIDNWREANVALVKSLPSDLLPELESVLHEAEISGWRVEELAKRLQERFDVSDSRAELIARDQVLKLNSELTEYRQTRAGITHYVWTTSDDERVRPAHADLEGTAHAWGDPPIVDDKTGRTAPPGQDYQCRCTAFPILPELGEEESLFPDG